MKVKENLMEEPCPKCQVLAGEPCVRENGKRPPFGGWVHKERVMLVRYSLTPDEVMTKAQEEFKADIDRLMTQITGPLYDCCGYGFGDLGALERHKGAEHAAPSSLPLSMSQHGWVSR